MTAREGRTSGDGRAPRLSWKHFAVLVVVAGALDGCQHFIFQCNHATPAWFSPAEGFVFFASAGLLVLVVVKGRPWWLAAILVATTGTLAVPWVLWHMCP
jgi:hypothetical protein